MINEYKYWLYYLNNDLYAYTDNKEYAKLFEVDRDMKKFIRKKRRISKEDVNRLARYEQEKYLVTMEIDIYDKKTMVWFSSEFIVTQMEKTTVNNIAIQVMNEDLYKYCWNNPLVFNKKILKALEVLQYNTLYRFITTATQTGEWPFEYEEKLKIRPDMLGIFLHYYGKTMKGV